VRVRDLQRQLPGRGRDGRDAVGHAVEHLADGRHVEAHVAQQVRALARQALRGAGSRLARLRRGVARLAARHAQGGGACTAGRAALGAVRQRGWATLRSLLHAARTSAAPGGGEGKQQGISAHTTSVTGACNMSVGCNLLRQCSSKTKGARHCQLRTSAHPRRGQPLVDAKALLHGCCWWMFRAVRSGVAPASACEVVHLCLKLLQLYGVECKHLRVCMNSASQSMPRRQAGTVGAAHRNILLWNTKATLAEGRQRH